MYADDMSCGAETPGEVVSIYRTAKEIMHQGGFNLRKFKCNDISVLAEIRKSEELDDNSSKVSNHSELSNQGVSEDTQTFMQSTVGLPSNDSEHITKVLGINWHSEKDEFFFDMHNLIVFAQSLQPTKRSLLKIAAKMFDPLGCLSVYTINFKILFQELCTEKVSWDEILQGQVRKRYDELIAGLQTLKGICIPRSLFAQGKKVSEIQLHAFSDASEAAYATVIYMRIMYESGEVDVKFVTSKAKVTPIHKQTIPRLELIGAGLMAKLMNSVKSVLQDELHIAQEIKTYYWVDSAVTLYWITNNRTWKPFVRRRVEQILLSSSREDWGFCPGLLNPADLPSRGKYGQDLVNNVLWWEGPGFLKLPSQEWPRLDESEQEEVSTAITEEISNPPNVTHAMVSTAEQQVSLMNIVDFQRFGTKLKLAKTLAWVLRFVNNLKASVRKDDSLQKGKMVSVTEIEISENLIIFRKKWGF